MTEYQKIAIGLLGRAADIVRGLRFVLSAMAIGSRTVALADNSQLVDDLSARARYLYPAD